jgi:hypothetical protein
MRSSRWTKFLAYGRWKSVPPRLDKKLLHSYCLGNGPRRAGAIRRIAIARGGFQALKDI